MIARLTYLSINTNDAEELRKLYYEEVVPVIKAQKGYLGAWLLEPANPKDDFISLTEWLTTADANAYESSGTYKSLVDKVRDRLLKAPVLKTYSTSEKKVTAKA